MSSAAAPAKGGKMSILNGKQLNFYAQQILNDCDK
jgi:hypothetical protein